MLNLSFIKQYISHPRTVEFEPGTGVFTDLLIERKEENTKLLVFETNDIFTKSWLKNIKRNHRKGKNWRKECKK